MKLDPRGRDVDIFKIASVKIIEPVDLISDYKLWHFTDPSNISQKNQPPILLVIKCIHS